MAAATDPALTATERQPAQTLFIRRWASFYGDIGTSPLYAVRNR